MQQIDLDLSQFQYDLPDEKIAKFPLANRSDAKLLACRNGEITHHHFHELPKVIPGDQLMVFNDTKVIPARLIFHKNTGARIEIFLLDPIAPSNVYEEVMSSRSGCEWRVMIGNAKKWKIGTTLCFQHEDLTITAERIGESQVKFQWVGSDTFSEMLTQIGKIPLPPYLGREASEEDKPRYQTVYSKAEGAVAAPTAGLHFSDEVLKGLEAHNIQTDFLTLHVSAGTFQPIKADNVQDHDMHKEQIVITRQNINNLKSNEFITAVGTTSMRTMESIYWFGQLLEANRNADFFIPKLIPYETKQPISKNKSLENILAYMDRFNTDQLIGHTEIFIFPGYQFKVCKALITNFHMPGSTLILLIAAFVGDNWRAIYDEALSNNYRFLSYGDSSVLIP